MAPSPTTRGVARRLLVSGGVVAVLVLPGALAVPANAEADPPASNVLVHYDMSHNGTQLLDVSGSGKNAVIRGGDSGFSERAGDDVLTFNGSTYVELPDFVGDNKSVVIQLRYSDGSRNNEALFSFGTTSEKDYLRFHPKVDNRYMWEAKQGGSYWKSGGAVSVGQDGWSTASAVLRSDSTADLVMNGVLDANIPTGTTVDHYAGVNGTGAAGYLGRPVWNGDPYFSGTLTDVLVYAIPASDTPASTSTRVVSTSFPAKSEGSGWWRSSMITGNGENGALVAGNPVSDTLIYQNIAFNMPNNQGRTTPDLTQYLDGYRQDLVAGRTVPGDPPGWGLQYDYGFHPGNQLSLQIPDAGVPSDHYRWTDYRTGEVGVNYTDAAGGAWERRTFTSRADNVVVTHLTKSSTGESIDVNLDLTKIDDMSVEGGSIDDKLRYKQFAAADGSYIGQVAHYPSYNGSELAQAGYAGVTQVITKGGTKTVRESNATGARAVAGSRVYGVDIRDADEVFLITRSDRDVKMGTWDAFATQTSFPLVDDLISQTRAVAAKAEYQGTEGLDYAKMLAPHTALHGAEFDAVSLELPAAGSDQTLTNEQLIAKQKATPDQLNSAMIERSFTAGRYATISSSGFSAPRLGGTWIGAWNPQWQGDWTTDANVNLQIAGANIGDLPSEMDGFINLILRIAPDWEINAEKIYGMQDALLAPPRTDADSGVLNHFGGWYPFQYWNAGASWLLLPAYEYWLVHGNVEVPLASDIDVAALKSVLSPTATDLTDAEVAAIQARGTLRLEEDLLLPMLRKQSNFWDQMVDPQYYENAAGQATYSPGKTALAAGEHYLLLPCYSPENGPAGASSPVAINCSMDIGAAHDGLRMTMEIEKALGVVTPGDKWQKLSDALPPVRYDAATGALKEWSLDRYSEQHAHRHVSQAYFGWPAHDTQSNPTMAAGLAKTVELRKATAGDKSSGHGWLHMALIDARLKNGAGVTDALHALLGWNAYNSAFTTNHNVTGDSAYVTDILNTVPAVLLESLVYSDRGTVQILPAIPDGMAEGTLSGSLARSRAEVSTLSWSLPNKTATATIRSDVDQTIALSSGQQWKSVTIDGRVVKNTGAPISLTMTAGQSTTAVFALGEPEPSLDVAATASVRCVAGKATVAVQATNNDSTAVAIQLESPFGSKSFASIAPGKSASHVFTTRQAKLSAGEVAVTATATVNGTPTQTQVTAAYPARSCG